MNGFMIGSFYLTFGDLIYITILVIASFLVLNFLAKYYKNFFNTILVSGSKWLLILRVLALLLINYPMFLIKEISQQEANQLLEPNIGYLVAVFLICFIIFLLYKAFKDFKTNRNSPLIYILYLQVIITSSVWVYEYFGVKTKSHMS